MVARTGQTIIVCLLSINLLISVRLLVTPPSAPHMACSTATQRDEKPIDDKSTTSAGLTTKTETLDRMLVSNDVSTKIPSDRHIRIFCWVTTTPSDIGTKAWAVYNTWMKRCDGYIFVSSKPSRQHFIPLLVLNVTDGRRHLTAKTMQSFQYIFKNHIHEFDWFLKGDDDTYVIVDNLRHFLSNKNTNDSVYFGARISNVPWAAHVREGYNAGGSGYVLSKEALRRLGEHRTNNPEICPVDGLLEDVDISFCLQKLGVKLGHTEDKYGRVRFHNYDPAFQMAKLHQYSPVTPKDVVYPFSDTTISFHKVKPDSMYMYDYLLYKFKLSDQRNM